MLIRSIREKSPASFQLYHDYRITLCQPRYRLKMMLGFAVMFQFKQEKIGLI